MFSVKNAAAVLLAGAAPLWLAAAPAHAQGCGATQTGTGQQLNSTQLNALLTALQQQQSSSLSATGQQQRTALLTPGNSSGRPPCSNSR